jgi:hypothetical protein
MKQRKLPHRLFAPPLAQPDMTLGLPFGPTMTISSAWKPSQQSEIYVDIPSNTNAPLTVKGKYICHGFLGGALYSGLAYGSNTKHALPSRRQPATWAYKGV